jgi:hypothetical protein
MATENSVAAAKIEKERSEFRRLLLENPNYFGNLTESKLKSVKKLAANTQYEELTCVGFNPDSNFLEATIAVKLAYGYGGNLCLAGTTEYVRFFLDYGSGWEDAGLAAVSVHDIPNSEDCAKKPTKPLTYVASLRIKPDTACCTHPVLPKVHAILSWEWAPPPGPANVNWTPPWGNSLECHLQVKPHQWNIWCILETLPDDIIKKVKLPPLLEQVKYFPIPLPDPPPFTLSDIAKMYSAKEVKVESHRLGVNQLHAALSSGFDAKLASQNIESWKALGLDWATAVGALSDTEANVSYEEIECLGIDDSLPERLVATFRIKRPYGYSGELCYPGSTEYVAFWADWDNKCVWSYLGTVKVNVHDIKTIPKDGLCYSAILPVDLTYHRQNCDKPKIGRVRAVLSWAIPPSTVDPNALNYWGNRLDTHVQITPGDVIQPGNPQAKIRNLGGIPVEDIDYTGNGMTKSGVGAQFAHYPAYPADGWGLDRECPFGGTIVVEGNYYNGYYYRVKAHKQGDPPNVFNVLSDSFQVERWDLGFDWQIASGGFFKYLDPALYFDRRLAQWNSYGDVIWEFQLDIATAPNEPSIIASSPWYKLQLDNTAPAGPPAIPLTMDVYIISGGGDCKDVTQSSPVNGTFVADDIHFGGWSLSTEPNTLSTPSNQPTVGGLANTDPAPAPGGHAWSLDTANPIAMKPCGYVVRLDVSDRSIVSSLPGIHNSNHIEVGFCLRAK